MASPDLQNSTQIISTGSGEIDKKLGGGISVGSPVRLEGLSDAGKSVVSQHFTHGAMTARLSMAYYTTENTVKSLMSQMSSLNLDVTDYFLCDRMRILPLSMGGAQDEDAQWAFEVLIKHIGALPLGFKLVIVDSLTGLVANSDDRAVIDFFAAAK